MGSGTTGRAALALGFRFTGIEKNPEYFRIATQRVVGTATPTPQPPVDPLAFFGLEE
jgi:DNA modification methylase